MKRSLSATPRSKSKNSARAEPVAAKGRGSAPAGPLADLLSLQRSVGNVVVTRLIQSRRQTRAGPLVTRAAPVSVQRRTFHDSYTVASKSFRPFKVKLTITGAPGRETDDFRDFLHACMDGIRQAVDTVGGGSRGTIRVRMQFRRGREVSAVAAQAYSLARRSLGIEAGERRDPTRKEPAAPSSEALEAGPSPDENPEQRLRRQRNTLQQVLAREVVNADREGFLGITFEVVNTGDELYANMRKGGPQRPRPSGTTYVFESTVARNLSPIMNAVEDAPNTRWAVVFMRDGEGRMAWRSMTKLRQPAVGGGDFETVREETAEEIVAAYRGVYEQLHEIGAEAIKAQDPTTPENLAVTIVTLGTARVVKAAAGLDDVADTARDVEQLRKTARRGTSRTAGQKKRPSRLQRRLTKKAVRKEILSRGTVTQIAGRKHRGATGHQVPDGRVLRTINDPQTIMVSKSGNWIFYRDGTIVVTPRGRPDFVNTAHGKGGRVPQRRLDDIRRINKDPTIRIGDAEPPVRLEDWIGQQRGDNRVRWRIWP